MSIRRQPVDRFLSDLEGVGLLDAGGRRRVEELLAAEPTLYAAEAVREVAGLSEEAFLKLLCEECGSEYVPAELLAQWPIEPEALAFLSQEEAHELAVFPLHYDAERRRLLVATAYPFSPHALEDLAARLEGIDLEVTFCNEEALAELLRRGYLGDEEPGFELPSEEGFEIGAATDEEAFPGIYGQSVADLLYELDAAEVQQGGAATGGEQQRGVHGSLTDMSVPDILQLLGQNRKSCVVFFESPEGKRVTLHLHEGMLVEAEGDGGLEGEEALYEVLAWERGHFDIRLRPYTGQPKLLRSVEELLLDGMRILDERRAGRGRSE